MLKQSVLLCHCHSLCGVAVAADAGALSVTLSLHVISPLMETSSVLMKSPPAPSFRLNSWPKTKKALRNRILGLAKRCRFLQLQVPASGQSTSRRFIVHVVKGGETLTSISKRYGVSLYAVVAANLEIVDVDLVLEGQCLNIPISVEGTNKDPEQTCNFIAARYRNLLNFHLVSESRKLFFAITPYYPFRMAKSTGYFLVLVPAIAFCIGCIMKVLQDGISKQLKQRWINKGHAPFMPATMRWRTVIYDETRTDAADEESKEESWILPEEEQSPAPFEEVSHAYSELEATYSKFLADCGMSKYGYWRGGSKE